MDQKTIASPGRGILAIDESNATAGKRLASIGLDNTEANRQAYRQLLLTTPGLGEYISGCILFEETLYQSTTDGKKFVDCMREQNIVPGIKVDKVYYYFFLFKWNCYMIFTFFTRQQSANFLTSTFVYRVWFHYLDPTTNLGAKVQMDWLPGLLNTIAKVLVLPSGKAFFDLFSVNLIGSKRNFQEKRVNHCVNLYLFAC